MKKILAFVLALCLTLSLSVAAFAAGPDSPSVGPDSPIVNPDPAPPKPDDPTPPPVNPNGQATGNTSGSVGSSASKFVYTAKTASGVPLTASIDSITTGDVYNEVKGYGVIAVYYVAITSAVSADEMVNIEVYAPGVTKDCVVLVRDEWEVLEDVTLTVNGNKAVISAPAGVLNTWHYVAIVSNYEVQDVETPSEPGSNDDETEDVTEAPTVEAPAEETPTETPAATPAETNPTTGIALAVVPMLVAAAAVVASKKR